MLCPAPPKAHHPHSAVLFPSSDNSPASVFLSSPPEISLLKLHYLFLPKSNHNLGSFLIVLDTLLNLSHPSRNSPRTAPISSTSFTASPRVLPIPVFTDVPKFPSSKLGRGFLGAHAFLNALRVRGGAVVRLGAEPR